MVLKPEQERVKTLLSDTVTLLCRNGLTYNKKFSITALIGITLDDDDVVLVEIKETVKNNVDEEEENSESESYQSKATSRKRKRKRRHSRQSSDSDNENGAKSDQEQNSVGSSFANPAGSDVKREQTVEDDSDEDLVFIKDEPGLSGGDMSNLYSQHNDSNQMYSSQQPPPGDILGNLGQQGQLYATPASSEHIGGPLPGPSTSWSDSSMSQQFPGGAGLHGNALSQQAVGSPMQGKSSQGSGSGPYECRFCGARYQSAANQYRHERRNHLGVFRYRCDECGHGQSGLAELRAHLASVHGHEEHKVRCPHCDKHFTRKSNMTAHVNKVHPGMGLERNDPLAPQSNPEEKSNVTASGEIKEVLENQGKRQGETGRLEVCGLPLLVQQEGTTDNMKQNLQGETKRLEVCGRPQIEQGGTNEQKEEPAQQEREDEQKSMEEVEPKTRKGTRRSTRK